MVLSALVCPRKALYGTESSRRSEDVKRYAAGCVRVAQELDVTVIDLHEDLQKHAEWRTFFHDGLHPGAPGSDAIWACVKPVLEEKLKAPREVFPFFLDLTPENLKAWQ